MRADYSDTFWNHKHAEQVSALNEFIPMSGAVPNARKKEGRVLEDWRRMQNMYYEVYNNGGINWGTSRATTGLLRRLVKKYLYKEGAEGREGRDPSWWGKDDICPPYSRRIMQYQVDNLEALATAVFVAVCKDRGIDLPPELQEVQTEESQ